MIKEIDKRIARALNGVRAAFRGIGARTNSAGPVQMIQAEALADEKLIDAEYMQHYGLTSHPPSGFMYVAVPVGGNTAHSMIIATEHASYRIKNLKPGEVAIYTDEGAHIILKRGKLIEVVCDTYQVTCKNYTINASAKAVFTTPLLHTSEAMTANALITGSGGLAISGGNGASVDGSMTVSGDVKAGGKSAIHHTHPGDSGGTTGQPN
ncbi:MAG: phage baseplate assembly protein V [Proteobacteria bacterium]|nr:phage baseplate assembly protein V [Pseudomonadota bacterium]